MVTSIFATKIGMTQAWDAKGKRLAVTRCQISPNLIVSKKVNSEGQNSMYMVAYGPKKLANMTKPLRSLIEKANGTVGARQIKGVKAATDSALEVGNTISVADFFHVGDIVKVQGVTKGRGFAGAMKRHGFHGGPKTHGQSDRARAVGSIGAGTTPGKVYKGQKMPGHYGTETKTVPGLVVLHVDLDKQEVWLSGPVPGAFQSTVTISPTGKTKSIELDIKASGITLPEPKVEEVVATEATAEAEVATEEVAS
jgi:large subunit ribosomal protein L3